MVSKRSFSFILSGSSSLRSTNFPDLTFSTNFPGIGGKAEASTIGDAVADGVLGAGSRVPDAVELARHGDNQPEREGSLKPPVPWRLVPAGLIAS